MGRISALIVSLMGFSTGVIRFRHDVSAIFYVTRSVIFYQCIQQSLQFHHRSLYPPITFTNYSIILSKKRALRVQLSVSFCHFMIVIIILAILRLIENFFVQCSRINKTKNQSK